MTEPCDLLPRWLVEEGGECASTPPPPAHIHLQPWDDGFTPSGCNGRRGQIVTDQRRSTPNVFRVLDNAVSTMTADLLYASAVRARVWGVFVPTAELSIESIDERKRELIAQDEAAMDKDGKARYRKALARLAVEEFLVAQAGDVISSEDWNTAHGVAVWVIASDCDDETEYHLDYAEMLRYETNVIFPPIYGATLHVSPFNTDDAVVDMEGGGFHVNLSGLEHYKTYGYKTRLYADTKVTTDQLEEHATREPGWQSVGYRYRRGIICDGEFPHFSARVRSLPPSPAKRVVVGFNLFPHEIGEFVERFPEHSDAFNRYVKLSQTAVKAQQGAKQTWSLESIKKNPKQAAFIKYLARKVREAQAKQRDADALHNTVQGV